VMSASASGLPSASICPGRPAALSMAGTSSSAWPGSLRARQPRSRAVLCVVSGAPRQAQTVATSS